MIHKKSSPQNSFIPREHEVLLKISQNIISTLDYEKVLQIISDGMSELLGIETAAIYILENKDVLHLGATTPPLDPGMPQALRKAMVKDHPHIQKTINTKKSLFIPDTNLAELSNSEKEVVLLRNLRSLVFFPFEQEQKVLGVLILGTQHHPKHFTQNEIDLGQTVANQLSIGIQNALLHHNLQIRNQDLREEIRQREKIEQDLRVNKTHLSNALRIGKLGPWEYDIANDLFLFSDELFEIYKTSANQFGGYTMKAAEYARRFSHPDDYQLVKQEIKKAIETNDENLTEELEHKIIYSDGTSGYVLVRYRIIKDDVGQTLKMFGINQDITEQKHIEKELKDHRDNLEKLVKQKTRALDKAVQNLKATNIELSSKNGIIEKQNIELKDALKNLREAQSMLVQSEKMASLGVLTAGVAHEINNPLNFIMGAYEGLKNNLPEDDCELQKELLEVLKTGLVRAQNIVKSLNQLSRSSNIKNEDCHINEIVENCLIILQNQIKGRIEIRENYKASDAKIKGNLGNLHQVFLNILANAIQSIKGLGKITISTSRQNNNIVIEVKDTGIGIAKENISKITDPFFTTKAPGEGTGLGLSIAYRIVQEHHGKLEFDSTPNKGTVARVVFPINL